MAGGVDGGVGWTSTASFDAYLVVFIGVHQEYAADIKMKSIIGGLVAAKFGTATLAGGTARRGAALSSSTACHSLCRCAYRVARLDCGPRLHRSR